MSPPENDPCRKRPMLLFGWPFGQPKNLKYKFSNDTQFNSKGSNLTFYIIIQHKRA